MTAESLLQCLQASGLTVRAEGNRLMVSPANLVTDEIRALVKPHRDALLALLTELPPLEKFVTNHSPGAFVEILIWKGGDRYEAVSAAEYALAMGDKS